MRLRLSVLIPALLILSSLIGGTLLFWDQLRTARRSIEREAFNDINTSLTHLQNVLNTQLAADNLEDAKLSLAVSALHPGIQTLLLTDEEGIVMLAHRFIWEGSRAVQVSAYDEDRARQVRQSRASAVALNDPRSLLVGYYPVRLKMSANGRKSRIGILFVEHDLSAQFSQARHRAIVQAAAYAGLMIAISMIVAILLHFLVSRRVGALVTSAERFAGGDLDARARLRGADELAALGRSFDHMADQRRAAEETAVRLNRWLHSLLDAASEVAIIATDINGMITLFNRGAERMLGYTAEEMVNRETPLRFHVAAEVEARAQELGEELRIPLAGFRTLVAKAERAGQEGREWTYLRRDGTQIAVSLVVTPVRSEVGEIAGYLAIAQDISERRRAEDEVRARNQELEGRLRERTAQLEAARRELETFSFSVSHDLRAPLRAIDGFSRILIEDHEKSLDPEARRLLGVVRDNGTRMAQLIDDILSFSRIGRRDMEPGQLDIAALAQSVFDELNAASPERPLRLEIGALPAARGDRAMIRQVLTNLISNAIKFTAPRAAPLIEIGGEALAAENHYYVRDNGVGFEMQYVAKLFGVFQRLHSNEQFAGTGIGLAIVKRIIERHGGRVWAEGQVDAGATFHFTLPPATAPGT